MRLIIILVLLFACVNKSLAFIEGVPSSDCKPISECELCERGQLANNECEETGRHIKWSCNEEDENEDIIEYTSCKRTRIEEEYNVVRFEAVCLLISLFSLRSVRREKLLSESLFDKLKRQAKVQQQQQGKSSRHEQEMTPLVSSASTTTTINTTGTGGDGDYDRSNDCQV